MELACFEVLPAVVGLEGVVSDEDVKYGCGFDGLLS